MERVGIYNRCSTEEESQMNALATQVLESREIAERRGWQITEQYVESQTGTVAYKRKEYQRLLADMEEDRFDIVMIKSIDRLMRSAKDWYFFLSRLTENRLRLYIYIEGKFYTPEDNLITGIKAILAEDFSRELSKKIKNAHRRRQEKQSGCNLTCPMFGWNRVGRDLYELNEKEAQYYRMGFALAAEGKGFYSISNILHELGARGKSGQKISEVQWRKMLYSPRAHGTVVLNTKAYNFDTKKYEAVPEDKWIFMENALPPIVSKAYQEEVIGLMKKRAAKYKVGAGPKNRRPGGKYRLTGKIKCAECGRYYYRTCYLAKTGKKVVWKCAAFLESGRKGEGEQKRGCNNIHLREDEFFQCIEEPLKGRCELSKEEKAQIFKEIMRLLRKSLKDEKGDEELRILEKEYEELAARKDMLMEKLLTGVIGDEDFARYRRELTGKANKARLQIDSIKQSRVSYNHYEARLLTLSEVIQREALIKRAEINEVFEEIDFVQVHRDGRLLICFLGEEQKEAWYGIGH